MKLNGLIYTAATAAALDENIVGSTCSYFCMSNYNIYNRINTRWGPLQKSKPKKKKEKKPNETTVTTIIAI